MNDRCPNCGKLLNDMGLCEACDWLDDWPPLDEDDDDEDEVLRT